MKKPGRGSSSGKPPLSDEDRAAWEHTAGTIEPLKRGKARVHPAGERVAGQPIAPADREAPPPPSAPAAEPKRTPAPPGNAAIPHRTIPPLGDVTPNDARKLRSGKVEIEARIDLHGMRQSEAHAALRRFIARCHGQGVRWVLVITGKGAPGRRLLDDDGGEREPGVLKRNVPRWLDEPDLRAMVVGFKTAGARHGGEGAIYVQLRGRRS